MRTTRRTLLHAAVGAAAIANLAPRAAAAATLAEIKARGAMEVATEDDYRPFEFVKDGVATGFDTGKYDAAVTGALITKERQQFLDFCTPISDATIYYVRRAKDTSITSIKDLSGKTVGVQAGSAMLQALPQLEAMLTAQGGKLGKVVQYVSYPEAYQDLALGRTDFVTNTVINLNLLIKEKPGVFALGQPVAGKTYIAWAVKKGNTSLLSFFNEFLLAQRKNGVLYSLQKTWLGQSFEDMPEQWTAT